MIHIVRSFGVVNEREINVFLEFSCFLYNQLNVGNLISGSSAFLKSNLNIWKFTGYILLKPCLEKFEHYFACMSDECNWAVVWRFFGNVFLWNWNANWSFSVLWPCWFFYIYWDIEGRIFAAWFFRIWTSSTEIPSPPLALFVVMLPNVYLTSHSRRSGSRWVII